MSVCQFLHERLRELPRFKADYDPQEIPENGLYFVFERDEAAHNGERIVRVGTHTGQNNLPKRLKEHLYTMNKDRSIFRKHVGRCLLARLDDPFLETWDIDLTTRQARAKFEHLVDKKRLGEVEQEVSAYMNANFSFVVLRVGGGVGHFERHCRLRWMPRFGFVARAVSPKRRNTRKRPVEYPGA